LREGKKSDSIFLTGNTAIDALKFTIKKDYMNPVLKWVENSRLVILTAHRRENLGRPLENIFRAIKRVVAGFCI
jgi:UDP-N-acetylglucosamine 2-epimerase (non-hydrolysing)